MDSFPIPQNEQEALALLEQMASLNRPARLKAAGALAGNAHGPADTRTWGPDLRYRSLIEKLPAVTFMAGLNDDVEELYISPQIEGLLGFTQEEWLANPFLWMKQLHPDDYDGWVKQFANTCSTGAHFRSEYRLFAKDGRTIWIQGECQVVRDDEGSPIFLQGIAFDITHRKRAAEDEKAKLAAEAASQAKSEFLARMSHEIRTPLNGVVGMVDLLQNSNLNEEQQRYAQLARDAANSLLTVINDILDFSKIEAGKVEIESIEFDLPRLIEDLTELLGPMAGKKNLALACFLKPDVPERALGDPNRIRQILTNLINNALKFTTKGSVSIRAEVTSKDEKGLTVRIEVVDTGIGIPADRLDRLFKSFSQVDSSTTRKFGGTGLGLAISKRLVELMGGQIGIHSTEGQGTTFWFTLKLGAVAEQAGAVENQSASGNAQNAEPNEALKGLHLLVAEDNEMNQFVTRETLRRVGCTCDIVADGALAVEAVEVRKYDAILMDCQMPGMDGLEATAQIRRKEAAIAGGGRVPIIALTAEAIAGDREKCIAAGMDGYVSKPIDADALFTAIATLVRRAGAADASVQSNSGASIAPLVDLKDQTPIDVEALYARCLRDGNFATQTLEKFQQRAISDVESLRQGIATGDAEGARRLAHNLKAVAGHVSANKLRQIAFEIEQAGARSDMDDIEKKLGLLAEEARRCAEYIPAAIDRIAHLPKSVAKKDR